MHAAQHLQSVPLSPAFADATESGSSEKCQLAPGSPQLSQCAVSFFGVII
jgi:hypothetical protein